MNLLPHSLRHKCRHNELKRGIITTLFVTSNNLFRYIFYNMQDDVQLVLKCQSGDKMAFGEIYDRYLRRLYDFIYFKTHHRETAEDLVSLVFTKALENIKSFDPQKGTLQAWLFQISRNTVIDHYRTFKKEYDIEDAWDIGEDNDIERDLDTRQKIAEIEKYLQTLKAEQRDIVIMRVWQELSYREISEIVGKSEDNCKMIYSRAINKLRQEMPLNIFVTFLLLSRYI